MEIYRDRTSTIVLDDARAPVLVATWSGTATVRNVERFYAWARDQASLARKSGALLVMVSDAIDAGRPGADVRQAFATEQMESDIIIASPTVITNPLVRGALTAVGWLLGDRMKGVTAWSTLDEAFAEARRALAERGVSVDPTVFAEYARPTIDALPRVREG